MYRPPSTLTDSREPWQSAGGHKQLCEWRTGSVDTICTEPPTSRTTLPSAVAWKAPSCSCELVTGGSHPSFMNGLDEVTALRNSRLHPYIPHVQISPDTSGRLEQSQVL